jgi:hypothetical protein
MDLASAGSHPRRMKAFPTGRRGVLLPCDDRRTAALGICLYTASKSWVIALQVAAYWVVRLLGARVLPGRAEPWAPPCPPDEWEALVAAWQAVLGPIDGMALYQRRQHDRSGLTLLVTRSGSPVAVIKLRDLADGLEREQSALAAVQAARPSTFRAPRPLGHGSSGRWQWSAQESVFRQPHRPVLVADAILFDEVSAALTDVVGPLEGEGRPAHRDLTPWNLRSDSRGSVWLYDWEDAGPAPYDADRAYFSASAAALGGTGGASDLPTEAIDYCVRLIDSRSVTNRADAVLAARMKAALAGHPTYPVDPRA